MKNNKNKAPYYEFCADLFHFDIDESYSAYKSLSELICDREFLESYFYKKDEEFKNSISKDNLPDELDNGLRTLNILSKLKGIADATIIFNRQTLVVLVTIIESMLDEFFVCVFCVAPEKMYEYIQLDEEGKVKGKIHIKELVNSPTREELLLSLAKQAASRAMQGKFKSVIKRLKKVTIGEEFSKDLLGKIITLNETRNKIVHELSDIEVSFDEVKKAFETAFEMVEYLEKIAKQMGIPTDVTEDEEAS
jgi:hypothetical protein